MLWFLLRLLSLMMTILPILFLYRSEETDEQKKIKHKNICVVISTIGIILFIVTIFMRWQ
jgi:4-hydroxybenzoate polyprenyltransferase